MPNPVQEAAVEAVELEAFSKEIPDLLHHSKKLYSFLRKKAHLVPVSNETSAGGTSRPSFRVPMRLKGGAAGSQGTGDGDSLGRGTGSKWDGFALKPVFVFNTNEITYLSRRATEGKNRGMLNVQAQELKNSLASAEQFIEGLLNSDGSGAVSLIGANSTVSSGSGSGDQTSYIIFDNTSSVAGFSDQQIVQFFPSIGGTSRGTATISFVDVVNNQLWFSTVLPSTGGATAAGDYVMVNGCSGAAGSSVLGIRYWNVNSNTGTIGGLNRATYPGRLSQPQINLNGAALNQSVAGRAEVLAIRALGDAPEGFDSAVWYTGLDQALAIQNLYYAVQIANAGHFKEGNEAPDITKRDFAAKFGGRDVLYSATALPGRLDLLVPEFWYMGEMIPLEIYDFGGGQTMMPVPDPAGNGYLTSSTMSYVSAFQIANSNVSAGAIVVNAAQPTV